MTTTTIKYRPDLDIRNVGSLPRGTGAKFLIVILGEKQNQFIAKRWANKVPAKLGSTTRVITF